MGAPASVLERSVADEIVEVGRLLCATGMVTGSVGNISVRVGDTILITPTRTPWRRLTGAQLVAVDLLSGDSLGSGLPSIELGMHLAIYRGRADAGAVVHTHSRFATAWSFLDVPLEPATEETVYYSIGPVRTASPAPAGSPELGPLALAALGDSKAVLLAHHGVVTVDATAEAAAEVAEAVEHQASIAWLLRAIKYDITNTPEMPSFT